jgi:iron-sulfur cluster repair protein YtfE (RIC family)
MTEQVARLPEWAIMYAFHDAFRRDLDELLAEGAYSAAVRARWDNFSEQLHFHHVAEDEAMWPLVRAKLAANPEGLALIGAMEREHHLIDPMLVMVGDAMAVNSGWSQVTALLSRLREALEDHLAHEEADTLPLVSEITNPAELRGIFKALGRKGGIRRAAVMFPWALSGAGPDLRARVLGLLPPPVRLLYRAVWLPRYRRRVATTYGKA